MPEKPAAPPSQGKKIVRFRKPHPCGGSVFVVVREGPVMTLRCATCGAFVRLMREKFEKAAKEKTEKERPND